MVAAKLRQSPPATPRVPPTKGIDRTARRLMRIGIASWCPVTHKRFVLGWVHFARWLCNQRSPSFVTTVQLLALFIVGTRGGSNTTWRWKSTARQMSSAYITSTEGHDDDPDYHSYVLWATVCFLVTGLGMVRVAFRCCSQGRLRRRCSPTARATIARRFNRQRSKLAHIHAWSRPAAVAATRFAMRVQCRWRKISVCCTQDAKKSEV